MSSRALTKADAQVSAVKDAALDEMLTGFELRRVASHLLRRAHFRAEEIFSETVGDLAITPRQKALLIALYRNPGANQSELAEQIALDPNSFAEMVSRIERDGFLTPHPRSTRRAIKVPLYYEGRGQPAKKVMPADVIVEDQVLAPIPPEDRPAFIRCLRLMVGVDEAKGGE